MWKYTDCVSGLRCALPVCPLPKKPVMQRLWVPSVGVQPGFINIVSSSNVILLPNCMIAGRWPFRRTVQGCMFARRSPWLAQEKGTRVEQDQRCSFPNSPAFCSRCVVGIQPAMSRIDRLLSHRVPRLLTLPTTDTTLQILNFPDLTEKSNKNPVHYFLGSR
jgi:hypothetical protein